MLALVTALSYLLIQLSMLGISGMQTIGVPANPNGHDHCRLCLVLFT